jgi:hypothetical protein
MGASTIFEKAQIISEFRYRDSHLGTQHNNGFDFETTRKIIMPPYIPGPLSERTRPDFQDPGKTRDIGKITEKVVSFNDFVRHAPTGLSEAAY